jgi:chromosome partitioning protein
MPADGFAPVSQVGVPDMSVQQRDARVIVVGNEKGGAGKSTVSMH